jgi:N4-gp56 family major capsid protein
MKFEMMMINLALFAGNTNVTTDSGLTPEMKTFYSDYLIDLVQPKLVHDQFGQKHPIPKNNGKTIEFRKYDSLPALNTTPLQEGVTPDGQKLSTSTITAEVKQYGGYVELSDILLMTAIDNQLIEATKVISSQAALTLDRVTKEVLCGGTNVQYAEGQVESRSALAYTSESNNHCLTVNAIRKAVRFLKLMNAEKINGDYVGIIHPDCAYDLMNDKLWENVKTYSDPEDFYSGEIGRIAGVRFVESSEAKVFKNAGASGRDVYATLILGANAYGVTEVSNAGLRHIVKQLGSSGAADPLDQRATVGWVATKCAERLVEQYMVRIETISSFDDALEN